ncbi:MAG: SprT-like domain-containing protein [Chitinophagales bacterium]|nr:SprT-like domain-containing protein [Chitinophagales bacterium]MDW8393853.1 SprT-like domain-containing protein [Chitinophagales bacterium]
MHPLPAPANPPKPPHRLSAYLPEEAIDIIAGWEQRYQVVISAVRPMKHAYGVFLPSEKDRSHRIRINENLNPYAFLITLVHEMAHLTTWLHYSHRVEAHGPEWKLQFRKLMDEFRGRRIFPLRVTEAFRRHLQHPTYTHCCDPELMRALRRYDAVAGVALEQLPDGAEFRFEGQQYRKVRRLRRRILCRHLMRRSDYAFEPYVVVQPVSINPERTSA